MRPHRSARRSRLLLGALVVLAASACGAPHVGLSNGSLSGCYRGIPAATADVHDRSARLVGVHRGSINQAETHLPPPLRSPGDRDTTVCAFVLEGQFAPGQVEMARSNESGDYAVVLLASSDLRLVAAFVLDHVPHGLGGRLI